MRIACKFGAFELKDVSKKMRNSYLRFSSDADNIQT